MATIYEPKPDPLYSGLATGLSGALEQLAQRKIQQNQKQQQAQGLQALLGLSPEQSLQAVNSPEPVLKEFAKQKLAQPGNEAFGQALQGILGQGQPNQFNNQFSEGQEGQPTGEQQPSIDFSKISSKDAKSLVNIALKRREVKAREKTLKLKEKQEAFKQTKELRQNLYKESRTAKTALEDLNRMEDLEKENKLDTPGFAEFLKRSGMDIPALMNPGSEEFNKIVGNFQRGAKEIYGSRITNFELENFLKILPSLSQSPEGRKRVISNLKRLYRGNLAYKDAAKKIVRDNKGIPPLDLMEQIDDEVEPLLDKIAEQFKADLAQESPPGQNKLVTALQAGVGSTIGLPNTILGGLSNLLKVVL